MIYSLRIRRPFPKVWIFDWEPLTRNLPDWWFDRTVECRYLNAHGPYMVAILKEQR